MIDLSDYIAGGYLLIRANKPDWEGLRTELLAAKLISLSPCICPRLEITWGWTPGDRAAALKFGIPEAKMPEFVEWCQAGFESKMIGFSGFKTLEMARGFITRFLPDTTDLYLIGAGLHREVKKSNWLMREGKSLFEKIVELRSPLEPGGSVLGFEVVSFNYNDFGDSWLCSLLHRDMQELFGIRPNQYGLIDSYAEAKQVYDWIDEDEMKGMRAEPEPYYPWLHVSYPLVEAR